jgi:DNA-binding response OmpR family regulator
MSEAHSAKSILIVEDDVDVRETLAEDLTEEGYDAIAFAGGRAALEHQRSTKALPALILLDLMMPNMDGWEFRAEQQRSGGLTRVPTVILSADGNVEQNMSSLHADGYLRKPIHIKTLLQLVETFCGPPEQLAV